MSQKGIKAIFKLNNIHLNDVGADNVFLVFQACRVLFEGQLQQFSGLTSIFNFSAPWPSELILVAAPPCPLGGQAALVYGLAL